MGDVKKSLDIIYKTTKKLLKDNKVPMMVGGEHLSTYPVIKALSEKYPNLHVIHLDAHTDLRVEFLGMKYSHATFMRHAHEFLGDGKIYQFGIRSGDEEEFKWVKEGHVFQQKYNLDGLDKVIEKLKDVPVYITIDLDVLDPSVFPGTGTPEPGGITYKELLWAFSQFKKLNHLVGADLVELAPNLDPTGVSTIVAAKSLREMVLILQENLKRRDK